jgi:hypothetical protein
MKQSIKPPVYFTGEILGTIVSFHEPRDPKDKKQAHNLTEKPVTYTKRKT